MNKDIKISFIIPVYNAQDYIRKCVDSILSSGLDRDIEIILVDDGSTDNSPTICDEYASKSNLVKVIHQNNQGVATAMNNGVAQSSGEYLFFIDNDDWIDGTKIPDIIKILKETDVDIMVHKYLIVYPDKSSVGNSFIEKMDKSVIESNIVLETFRRKRINVMAQWEYIMKKRLLTDNNHIFEPDQAGVHDSCFTPILFSYSKSFIFNDNVVYFWRQRADSQGKTHKRHTYIIKMLSVLDKLKRYRNIFTNPDYIDFSIYKNAYSVIGQYYKYEKTDRDILDSWVKENKDILNHSASLSGILHSSLNRLLGPLNGIIMSYKLAVMKGHLHIMINKIKK